MGKTSIEWTDRSINPLRAGSTTTNAVGHHCEKVSPGCANCYASTLQKRFRMPEFAGPSRREQVKPFLDESKLQEVLRLRKPSRIFWCDMTDLFGDWVEDEWIDKCLATIALTPQHTHQVLTKRPRRMLDYFQGCVTGPEKLRPSLQRACLDLQDGTIEADVGVPLGFSRLVATFRGFPWPLPNLWLGVSVENQTAADERISLLLQVPAKVRFLSVEPLLGKVDLRPFLGDAHEQYQTTSQPVGVNWVIVGGESGPHARLCNVEWIRGIVAQCRAAGVACFVKQLGSDSVDEHTEAENRRLWQEHWGFAPTLPNQLAECCFSLRHAKGGDPNEWPHDLRVREFPHA